ncbi:TPA: hypothetical protein EYP66_19330 [Candidatus Poribacteria bacterium]|nr:hypothetical protein [Candidatus Poribacteria bacterium]
MPSERIYRMQAEQNERLARGLVLLSPQLMDWGVTACFYAALHLVDGYLARVGVHPKNHAEREDWIRRRLHLIRGDYRNLKRFSIRARYDVFQMNPATAFQPAFVENLIATELEAIRNYIAQLP